MRCARIEAAGSLVIGPAPEPVAGPGEVSVRVTRCALCRTDAAMWAAGHRDLVLPRIPGHEVSGERLDTGERVVLWPGAACGVCPACRRGAENLCPRMRIQGFHRDGGLAEYLAAPEGSLLPVPEGLPQDIAALAEPLACAVNALEKARLSPGAPFLVMGGGPVGLMAAWAAESRGAAPFVIEKDPARLARSAPFREALGIAGGLSASGRVFAAALNAAPAPETLAEGLSRLEPGGVFVVFSGLRGECGPALPLANDIHYRELTLTGAYGCTRRGMGEALGLLASRPEAARLLCERTIGLHEVEAAFRHILSGGALRYMVEPARAQEA